MPKEASAVFVHGWGCPASLGSLVLRAGITVSTLQSIIHRRVFSLDQRIRLKLVARHALGGTGVVATILLIRHIPGR